jgi:hypothetical protein
VRIGIAVVALALLAGCSGPNVVPIAGQVKFKDGGDPEPLAGYIVTFEPGEKRVGGTGVVGADGSFAISTFGENDGAVPGKHRIALTPPPATGEGRRPKPAIDKHYGDLETSGLSTDVLPQREPQSVVLEVERLK